MANYRLTVNLSRKSLVIQAVFTTEASITKGMLEMFLCKSEILLAYVWRISDMRRNLFRISLMSQAPELCSFNNDCQIVPV